MPPICRHSKGDPNCSSSAAYHARYEAQVASAKEKDLEAQLDRLRKDLDAMSPKNDQYEFVDVARVGPHLVGKVKYLSCPKCSFEGVKIMVWLDVTEAMVLRWRIIDPHFRDKTKAGPISHAPGPDARFPATDAGWADALAYAKSKIGAKS